MAGFRFISFEEITLLTTCVFVFVLLHFAARAVIGVKGSTPIMPLVGLMLTYVAFVFGSIFVNKLSLQNVFALLCTLAVVGVLRCRSKLFSEIFQLSLSILCAFPLLLLALVVNEPQWDDFTTWLVSARFLSENQHLPILDTPILNNPHPSYPYSRAMLHAWVSWMTGYFSINAQPVFNILFLSSLFLWPSTFFNSIQSKRMNISEQSALILASSALTIPWIVILGSTLVVSSYADPVFSICFVHIFMIFVLKCSGGFSLNGKLNSFNLQMIFLLLAAVSIKSSGLYLGLLAIGVIWTYDLFNSKILNYKDWFITQTLNGVSKSCYLLPTILFTYIWSFYLNKNAIPKSFKVRGSDDWNLDELLTIIRNTFVSWEERPYSLLAITVLVSISFIFNRYSGLCQKSYRALILFPIVFFVFCYLFQIAAYCFAFTRYEALYAASFTRYMAPAGLVAVFAIGMYFLLFTKRALSAKIRLAVATISFVSTALLLSILQEKINPEPRIKQSLYNVATSILNSYPKAARLSLIDIDSNGFEATVVRYLIGSHMPVTYQTLYPDPKRSITSDMLDEWKKGAEFLYVLSGPKYLHEMLGVTAFYEGVATKIKNSCPQNSSLLLVDIQNRGEEARKLVMILNGYYKISVKSSKHVQSVDPLNVDCTYNTAELLKKH